jgi:hypothetical protein
MGLRTTPSFDPVRTPPTAVDSGRLGVYAALGAGTGAVPLPWLPEWMATRVRGALVHDIATRRGASLSPEARMALADVLAAGAPRGLAANALRFVGAKVATLALARLGPAALLWPLSGALRTYALGRLFDRYLERHRTRTGRIEVDEARRLRRAIDGAMALALRVAPRVEPLPAGIDDGRDATTALLDSVLGFTAGLPSRVGRQLDAAFDEALSAEETTIDAHG